MYHFIGHIIKPVQKYDYTNKEDTNMTNIEKVNQFLDEAKIFYFLTTDGDKPKGVHLVSIC